MSGTPLTLTVDLAGDAPIPVAGMSLDPLGGRLSILPGPKAVALLLSDDGSTWQEVMHGELSPLTTDQYFVLPAPVPARFAQLRIDSTWGGTNGQVVLGEWKVIATPGAIPDTMPANIADPVRGGHVVWMDPPASSQAEAQRVLSDDPTEYAQDIGAEAGTAQTHGHRLPGRPPGIAHGHGVGRSRRTATRPSGCATSRSPSARPARSARGSRSGRGT